MFRSPANVDGRDTVVITGASKGIGKEIAKKFVSDGYNLIMVAKEMDAMEEARAQLLQLNPNVQIFTLSNDLATNSNAPEELFTQVFSSPTFADLRVNHLINNAGLCLRGDFLDVPLQDQLNMVQLNAISLTKLCYLFGNQFAEQLDTGSSEQFRIMNVASISSLMISPFLSVYSGAKAYVHSFTCSFNEELKSKYGSKITCTSLCPGFTESAAVPKAGLQYTNAFSLLHLQDEPEKVARVAYYAMMTGKRYAVVGWTNYILYWLISSVLPLSWSLKLVKWCVADVGTTSSVVKGNNQQIQEQEKSVVTTSA